MIARRLAIAIQRGVFGKTASPGTRLPDLQVRHRLATNALRERPSVTGGRRLLAPDRVMHGYAHDDSRRKDSSAAPYEPVLACYREASRILGGRQDRWPSGPVDAVGTPPRPAPDDSSQDSGRSSWLVRRRRSGGPRRATSRSAGVIRLGRHRRRDAGYRRQRGGGARPRPARPLSPAGAEWVDVRPTPPGHARPPGNQPHQTFKPPTSSQQLFLAPDDRPPRAGVKLVRPRRCAAAGAPARPTAARRHRTRQLRGKPAEQGTHPPARRPQVTGPDHHALLTNGPPWVGCSV